MSKENRFEGLMGVVGKNKKTQTSGRSDVQKSDTNKKTSSKSNVETSEGSNIQTSEAQAVNSDSSISTSKNSNTQTVRNSDSKSELTRGSTFRTSKKAKSVNPDYTRTTVYLPKKMHKKFKAIALDKEKEMSSIVEELIEGWLNSLG